MEFPIPTRTLVTGDCATRLQPAEEYCFRQVSNKLSALQADLKIDVQAELDEFLSNAQKLTKTDIGDKTAPFQQQASALINERVTGIEHELHHVRADVAHVHEQLLFRDKPVSSKKNPQTVISALQNEIASVKPRLNTALGTGASTAEVSSQVFRPTLTASREVDPADRAVLTPPVCVTQRTASIPSSPSGLVIDIDTAFLLGARLRL